MFEVSEVSMHTEESNWGVGRFAVVTSSGTKSVRLRGSSHPRTTNEARATVIDICGPGNLTEYDRTALTHVHLSGG